MLKVKDILWLAKWKQLLLLHCVKVLFFSKCTNWKNVRRLKNRLAIKSLLRCTHFLARNHIAHTTNFGDLVDLVVTCGGEDLKQFADKAGKNAHYTSKDAVVDFVEALGTWVDESLLARLQNARYFSLLADESTDSTTIEELSVVCRWVGNACLLSISSRSSH